jgi:SEC-C motif-containing protein
LIAGEQLAATAQQLMRSRFSAFTLASRDPQAIEHLLRTHLEPGLTAAARRKALMESCRTIQWLSLKVLDFQNGSPLDQHGTVTFEARWRDRDRDRREGLLKECSRFGRGESGEWIYLKALSLDDVKEA